jgi:hypothetical protein
MPLPVGQRHSPLILNFVLTLGCAGFEAAARGRSMDESAGMQPVCQQAALVAQGCYSKMSNSTR